MSNVVYHNQTDGALMEDKSSSPDATHMTEEKRVQHTEPVQLTTGNLAKHNKDWSVLKGMDRFMKHLDEEVPDDIPLTESKQGNQIKDKKPTKVSNKKNKKRKKKVVTESKGTKQDKKSKKKQDKTTTITRTVSSPLTKKNKKPKLSRKKSTKDRNTASKPPTKAHTHSNVHINKDMKQWMRKHSVYDKALYSALIIHDISSLDDLFNLTYSAFDKMIREFRSDQICNVKDQKMRNRIDKRLTKFERMWQKSKRKHN